MTDCPEPSTSNPKSDKALRIILAILLLPLIVIIAIACGSDGVMVKEEDYGDRWPLTVPEVELFCKGPYAVYVKLGDNRYGVNGIGSTYVENNYSSTSRDIEDIWRPNPQIPGSRINIGPLIDDGLKLCDS